MTYNSFDDFAKDQFRAFEELKDVDKVLRTALLDGLVLVKDRVQQRGATADNSSIGTYSKSWAKFRKSTGRQTSKIDLTNTGDMMRNFTIIPDGSDALGLGFTSDLEAKKAEGNEKRYGGPIFEFSDEEERFIDTNIEKKVAVILNRIS